MKSPMRRHRTVRISAISALVLAFIAWALSLAIGAPWAPWFAIVFWTLIAVSLMARLVRAAKWKRAAPDAFKDMNQIYQGRTETPYLGSLPAQSVEIGEPFLGTGPFPVLPEDTGGAEEPPLSPRT